MKAVIVLLALSASVLYALPIDCNGSQVCTGTVCVHQQSAYYCLDQEYDCDNDSQNYAGGNQVCCTNRTVCFTCTRNGHPFSVYNYSGMSGACTPN